MEDRIKKLYPCLRGIIYDENMFLVTYFLIPNTWVYTAIVPEIIIEERDIDNFKLLVIKQTPAYDGLITLSSVLAILESVVNFNLKEVKKNSIIEAQMNALKQLSYEEILNLSPEKLASLRTPVLDPDVEVNEFAYVQELENVKYSPLDTAPQQPSFNRNNIKEAVVPVVPQQEGGISYTPLTRILDEYSAFDAPQDMQVPDYVTSDPSSEQYQPTSEEDRKFDEALAKFEGRNKF